MSESHEMASDSPVQESVHGSAQDATRNPDRENDWTTPAVVSGVVGAFVVAIIFLAVDLIAGRPAMWTPAALGSALFMGDSVTANADLKPTTMMPVVFGYTLMHVAVFISFGAMAASGRLTRERSKQFTTRAGAVTALLIFVGLEITFVALGWIVGPDLDLAGRLGSGWIAVANALAAIAMTTAIGRTARRLASSSD